MSSVATKVSPGQIRRLRVDYYGETRHQFARRLNCSTKTVYNYESGNSEPIGIFAERLAKLWDERDETRGREMSEDDQGIKI
jgi:DNA-binding transcriptional regulator YiaG